MIVIEMQFKSRMIKTDLMNREIIGFSFLLRHNYVEIPKRCFNITTDRDVRNVL